MTKTLTALATAATIAVATVATPTTADARWGWRGGRERSRPSCEVGVCTGVFRR